MTPDQFEADAPATVQLLQEFGYSISWREAGWHECLISGHGESWHGQGPTRAEAFENALRQALPSSAARRCFEESLDARCAPERQPPAVIAAPEPPPAEPTVVVGSEPPVNGDPASAATSLAPAGTEAPAFETEPAVAPAAIRATADVVLLPETRRAAPRPPRHELLARFDEIDETIEAAQEEAGLLAPERQRLLLLSWIADARTLEELAGADREAFERTRRIAQRCSRLSKIWWPGSVNALAIEATPQDCAAELPAAAPPDLSSWSTVAAAAEAALAARESVDGTGPDEHGWSDAGSLAPRHHRPDALLREVASVLEKVTGPLLRASEAGEGAPRVAADFEPKRVIEVAPWLLAARKLRWVRGAVSDIELWAAAIGRLRWLAAKMQRARSEPLWRVLDAEFRPALSWAKDLGYDPDKRRRQKQRKELLSAPPAAGWSEERLGEWLLRAIDLREEMPKERIATLVAGLADRVLTIRSATFSTQRSQRVRLEAVQALLRKEAAPATPAPIPAPADEDVETEVEVESVEDRLVGALQEHTRGRTALFVSNRNDTANAEQVRVLLQFEAVDLCESKSATVAAKAKSIEQESYDFVLAATGFLPHTVDGVLKASARRAGVPYVSVNRGRPLSCARALARELGLAIPVG